MYDLIIIGGGPAGLTAGIYSGRAGLKTLLIEKAMPGGQAANTHLIENYPGFVDGIGGFELMQSFHQQAIKWGVEFITDSVTSLSRETKTTYVHCGETRYETKTVIVATGASPRQLHAKGADTFHGKGISYCGTCDGPLYRGKTVVVVGGGNTALQEIDFLSRFVDKIHLIHRGSDFLAQQPLIDKLEQNDKVEIHRKAEVQEIFGDSKVEGIRLKDTDDAIAAQGVFIFIGQEPNTAFCQDFLALDSRGFIKANCDLSTSKQGVFAAGDVIDKDFFQVATAVGDGALATHSVEMYLRQLT